MSTPSLCSSSSSSSSGGPVNPEAPPPGSFFWLTWYFSSVMDSHKHWALVVSYDADDEAFGTAYHAMDTDIETGQHELSVSRGVLLTGECGHDPYDGRLFLGFINDDVVEALQMYAEGATEMLNEANEGCRYGANCAGNCQDWCLSIVRSLEDSGCLEQGTLEKAKRCPRAD